MACYISSGKNRHYAAVESIFGQAAAVTAAERFTSLGLRVEVKQEKPRRRDKTGTRTYQGISGELRKRIEFELGTYLYQREEGSPAARYGALVEAAMGSAPAASGGGLTVSSANGTQVGFSGAHGLVAGQALAAGGEVRFVESVTSPTSVVVSAPFEELAAGMATGAAVTYPLAHDLKSVTLYDYWSPETAVQRILAGGAVDEMAIEVNGDFHEIRFRGEASELIDNRTFQAQQAGLAAFPAEPALAGYVETPVPGHLGQAWLGTGPDRIHTVKSARITIKNNIDFRRRDFGSAKAQCLVPGEREVSVELELYSQDKTVFNELYEAAQWRNGLPLMIQMGAAAGQMCGVWVPNFVPEVPEFVDDEPRLRWRVASSQAQGTAEDEVHVAFA
ncbi:MAG: hypothetical protein HXY18_13900 [Bryobacteraceae bacterium]|nr:hypothetical protein [Bryobacteraceae bacterium]